MGSAGVGAWGAGASARGAGAAARGAGEAVSPEDGAGRVRAWVTAGGASGSARDNHQPTAAPSTRSASSTQVGRPGRRERFSEVEVISGGASCAEGGATAS